MAALEGGDGQRWGEQLVHSLLEAFLIPVVSEPGKLNAHTV